MAVSSPLHNDGSASRQPSSHWLHCITASNAALPSHKHEGLVGPLRPWSGSRSCGAPPRAESALTVTVPSCPHGALTLPSHCRDLDPSHLRAPHALMLGPRRGHAEGLCACPRVIGPLRRPPCGEREGSRIKSARASRGVKSHRTGCPPRKGRLTKWPGPTKWPRVQVRARRALRAPHVPVTCGARTPYSHQLLRPSYVRCTHEAPAARAVWSAAPRTLSMRVAMCPEQTWRSERGSWVCVVGQGCFARVAVQSHLSPR